MVDKTISVADPSTRKDGTALSATDIVSGNVYRADGSAAAVKLATVAITGTSWTYVDHNLVPGSYGYQVSVTDSKGQEGDLSDVFPVVIAAPVAPPSAPTITSIV